MRWNLEPFYFNSELFLIVNKGSLLGLATWVQSAQLMNIVKRIPWIRIIHVYRTQWSWLTHHLDEFMQLRTTSFAKVWDQPLQVLLWGVSPWDEGLCWLGEDEGGWRDGGRLPDAWSPWSLQDLEIYVQGKDNRSKAQWFIKKLMKDFNITLHLYTFTTWKDSTVTLRTTKKVRMWDSLVAMQLAAFYCCMPSIISSSGITINLSWGWTPAN